MINRPIEFRTWDTQNKEFSEWTNRDPFFSTSHGQIFFWERVQKEDGSFDGDIIIQDYGERFVLQQFTNALDKNNNKIFEGDIVLFDNPDPYDGQDRLTKIVGYNPRAMGFRLYNFTHEINKYGGQVFFPEDVEVIGNIFEGAIKDGINYGEFLKEK